MKVKRLKGEKVKGEEWEGGEIASVIEPLRFPEIDTEGGAE